MISRAVIVDSVWLAVSAAAVIVLLLTDNRILWALGSLIVFVDIGRVIYRWLQRQEQKRYDHY